MWVPMSVREKEREKQRKNRAKGAVVWVGGGDGERRSGEAGQWETWNGDVLAVLQVAAS